MNFSFSHLKFIIKTIDASQLLLYLYRSATDFEMLFKRQVCSLPGQTCSDIHRCCYYQLFSKQLATEPLALKHHQKPPFPFIFSFQKLYATDECGQVIIELTLTGYASNHADEFISAIKALLEHGYSRGFHPESRIIGVESLGMYGDKLLLSDFGNSAERKKIIILDADTVIDSRNHSGDLVEISFLTPLRLIQQGKVLTNFDPGKFICALMRRISSISYYYCGYEMMDDFSGYADAANRVELIENTLFYGAANKLFNHSGIMGSAVLSGLGYELIPFLILGEYLHLGKAASYGMGRFKVSF